MKSWKRRVRSLIDKFVYVYGKESPVVVLESQSSTHKVSRYSFLAAQPKLTIKAYHRKIQVTEGEEISTFEANPWNALAQIRARYKDWLFGYLGYDLKNHVEQLTSDNRDEVKAPDLFFMIPSVLIRIDHKWQKIKVLRGKELGNNYIDHEEKKVQLSDLHSSVGYRAYTANIEQIKRDIYAGKYYELNYTHQLQVQFNGQPYDLYRKMRKSGPVPFGAYITFDDISVCSLSPERFLRKRGQEVISQPIKGTIRRGDDSEEDFILKKALQNSKKDRAENMMIVDLVRNDLSKIAKPGSVEVPHLFEIHSFSSVHQMISTISAVANETNPVEIVKACFPMGSMTGAPKIDVMKYIEELEYYKRGIYSGAIGYFTPYDDFDFNVVIRTALLKDNKLFYSVGGAITADSDPQDEWEEAWLKAKALKNSIE